MTHAPVMRAPAAGLLVLTLALMATLPALAEPGVARTATVPAANPPRIAIIIDDLGYTLALGRRAIALPGAISYAVLPGTPRAGTLARAANALGKDVLLHLPMQAVGSDSNAEPVSMTIDMSREHFSRVFAAAFESVPFATGVNNHRGSLLTRHPGSMQWLMEEIRKREAVFFIDSFTTTESVALKMAAETGVSALKRDVFLDTDPSPERIREQFERLKSLARSRGVAVAIGHPYESTLSFLEASLPELQDQGIELVSVSELVLNQSAPVHSKITTLTIAGPAY